MRITRITRHVTHSTAAKGTRGREQYALVERLYPQAPVHDGHCTSPGRVKAGPFDYEEREALLVQITPWERSALELLASGMTTSQIGRRLGVSEQEVERRLATLFAKMGAASQAEAVAAAARRGLLRA